MQSWKPHTVLMNMAAHSSIYLQAVADRIFWETSTTLLLRKTAVVNMRLLARSST